MPSDPHPDRALMALHALRSYLVHEDLEVLLSALAISSREVPSSLASFRTRFNGLLDVAQAAGKLPQLLTEVENIAAHRQPSLTDGPTDPKHPLYDWLQRQRRRWSRLGNSELGVGGQDGQRVGTSQEEIWVSLNAHLDRVQGRGTAQAHHQEALHEEHGGMRSFPSEDAFKEALHRRPERKTLVVIGPRGSGKTMLMRQLFLKSVEGGSGALGVPKGLIPVIIPLSNDN